MYYCHFLHWQTVSSYLDFNCTAWLTMEVVFVVCSRDCLSFQMLEMWRDSPGGLSFTCGSLYWFGVSQPSVQQGDQSLTHKGVCPYSVILKMSERQWNNNSTCYAASYMASAAILDSTGILIILSAILYTLILKWFYVFHDHHCVRTVSSVVKVHHVTFCFHFSMGALLLLLFFFFFLTFLSCQCSLDYNLNVTVLFVCSLLGTTHSFCSSWMHKPTVAPG